jgi:hypothetical protein
MSQDFLNFFMLYCMLALMFSIVGNLNFIYITEFSGFFQSLLTVINASLGNFNFIIFK